MPAAAWAQATSTAQGPAQAGPRHSGGRHPVPLPWGAALGHRGDRDLAAGDADCLHPDAAVRRLGQPYVPGGPGDRYRDDGGRGRGARRERVPAALARSGVRQADQQDAPDPGGRARGDQSNRVRDRDHHCGVPAAVLADGAGRQAVQADGADDHVRHGRLAAAVDDAGARACGADPEAQGGKGHLRRALGQACLPAASGLGAGAQEAGHQLGLGLARGVVGAVPVPRQRVHADVAGRHDPVPRDEHPLGVLGRIDPGLQRGQRRAAQAVSASHFCAGNHRPSRRWRDHGRELHGDQPRHEAAVGVARKDALRQARLRDARGLGEGGPDRRLRRDTADPVARRGTDLRRSCHAGSEAVRRGPGNVGPPDGPDEGCIGQGRRQEDGRDQQEPACWRPRGDGVRPHDARGQGDQHGQEEPAGRRGPRDRHPLPVPGQHPCGPVDGHGDPAVHALHVHGYGAPEGQREPDESGGLGLRDHHRRRGSDRRELRGTSSAALRAADHHDRLPADLCAGWRRREDVPPDGVHGRDRPGGRHDPVGDLRAGGRRAIHRRAGDPATGQAAHRLLDDLGRPVREPAIGDQPAEDRRAGVPAAGVHAALRHVRQRQGRPVGVHGHPVRADRRHRGAVAAGHPHVHLGSSRLHCAIGRGGAERPGDDLVHPQPARAGRWPSDGRAAQAGHRAPDHDLWRQPEGGRGGRAKRGVDRSARRPDARAEGRGNQEAAHRARQGRDGGRRCQRCAGNGQRDGGHRHGSGRIRRRPGNSRRGADGRRPSAAAFCGRAVAQHQPHHQAEPVGEPGRRRRADPGHSPGPQYRHGRHLPRGVHAAGRHQRLATAGLQGFRWGQQVVQRVAGGVEVGDAGQRQVLDVGGQRVADGGRDGVGALACVLDDGVADVVDDVEVVAGTADERVGPCPAVQRVVASPAGQRVGGAVAGQHVVQRVAGAVDGRGAGQRQVLEVHAERPGDAGLHEVGAFAGVLGDGVGGGVDDVGVVADAARHRVVAGTAVEQVVAVAAGHRVVAVAAVQEAAGAGDDEHGWRRRLVRVAGREQADRAPLPRQIGVELLLVGRRQRRVGDDDFAVVGARHPLAAVAVADGQRAVEAERLVDGGDDVRGLGQRRVDVGARVPGLQRAVDGPGRLQVGVAGADDVGRGVAVAGDQQPGIAARAGVERHVRVDAGAAVDGREVQVADGDRVGTCAGVDRVGPATANDDVVAGVAGDDVGQAVAGGVDVGAAGQRQVLEVGGQRPADAGVDGVVAAAGLLVDRVADVVDDVGVVSRAAHQHVGASAAVQHVVAAVAGDGVAQRVAGAVDVAVAGQHQRLDVGGQCVVDAGLDDVGAFARVLDDEVTGVVDDVGVVAQAAGQHVGAGATVQHVVAVVAGDEVDEAVAGAVDGVGAGQHQVFEVGAQHPADGAAHGVRALAGVLGDDVAGAVDDVGVVARAADEAVVSLAAVQRVVAGVAGDLVVQRVAGAVEVGRAGQHEVLDVVGQRVADAGRDGVGAAAGGLDDGVAGVVDDVAVVARAAHHAVRARAAVQQVVAGVAGEHVVQRVAGAIQVGTAGQHEVLDVVDQHVADGRLHRVAALARVLGDEVADVVDDVGVVAGAAGHLVGTQAAVQHVVAGVAGQRVGEVVAGAVDVVGAGQHQVLDVGAQRPVDGRLHRVVALGGVLDRRVAAVVDDVDVVTDAADQLVGARTAVQHVGAAVAGDDVGQCVTGAVEVVGAGEDQVLDVVAEREADAGAHQIHALARRLDDDVAGVVDVVGVVARATCHRVGAQAAVDDVVVAVAGDLVGGRVAGGVDAVGAGQHQVFEVGAQRVGDAGADRVRAFAGVLDDDVTDVVDDVGVVARAAHQAVGARAAVQHVGAAVAGDDVVQLVAGAVDAGGAGQYQVLDVRAQHEAGRSAHGVDALARVLDDLVARVVDDVGVVARAARHDVGARAAVDDVVAAVAGDLVGQLVAGAVQVGRAREDQVLDVGFQHAADRGDLGVGARARVFDDDVAGGVDVVGVVTAAAGHRVGARAAVDDVGGRIAGDLVVAGVAGATDVAGAGQHQVLQRGAQPVADAGADRVRTLAARLDDLVAGVVDDVGVVAQAAGHDVGARAAVQHVVAAVAGELVGLAVAGAVDVGGAGEDEVLDIGAQREADAAAHEVRALAHRFGHRVAGVVDEVGVVARAAGHLVGTGAAVDEVGAGVAGDRVVQLVAGRAEHVVGDVAGEAVVQLVAGGVDVAGAGQHQALDVGAEREADARTNRVRALAAELGDGVAEVVDDRVVAGVAGEAVGQLVAGAVDIGAARQHQVLDVGAERERDAAAHGIRALAGCLGDGVTGVVDDVDVVAGAAGHRVGTRAAVEGVVAGIAAPGSRRWRAGSA
ncbi:unnamed protein product [Rotaria sp. Silwood1]|nr:unnamed protein product [Rotaria sp. Silwood1]